LRGPEIIHGAAIYFSRGTAEFGISIMKKEDEEKRKPIFGFRILGWVFGGLSILSLVQDLSPLLLYGKLKIWVEAYGGFVENIRAFLFGWINFGWISISSIEAHLLVINGIICFSFARAETAFRKSKGRNMAMALYVGKSKGIRIFLFVLFFALILPSMWGFGMAAIAMIWTSSMMLFFDFDNKSPSKNVRKELIGSLSVFVFLVALNYSIFKH